MKKLLVLLVLLPACAAFAGQTIVLDGLYNTGVDDNGAKIVGSGQVDEHYSLDFQPLNSYLTVPPAAQSYADAYAIDGHPRWVNPTADARWISPTTTVTSASGGYYDYKLTFDIAEGVNLDALKITGKWATDNSAWMYINADYLEPDLDVAYKSFAANPDINGDSVDIYGVDSLIAEKDQEDYANLDSFEISSGFVTGNNVLMFRVFNHRFDDTGDGNPTGLLVSDMCATTVPAPGAILLSSLGCGFVGWLRRRKTL